MKIFEFKVNNDDVPEYKVKEECINIIHGKSGIVILPKVIKTTYLRVVFAEYGDYKIVPSNGKLDLGGTISYTCLFTRPGTQSFDLSPEFIFLPKKDSWMILQNGMLIREPSAEEIEAKKAADLADLAIKETHEERAELSENDSSEFEATI